MTHSSFNFRLGSLNVRGINKHSKRISIFNWIKSKQFDIMLLQETFSAEQDESLWKSEWEGQCFFAHGTKHSRGVAILVKKGFDFDPISIYCDANGRYIIMKTVIQGEVMFIVNIYAPNTDTDKTSFFNDLHNKLKESNIKSNDIIYINFLVLHKISNLLVVKMILIEHFKDEKSSVYLDVAELKFNV